MPETYANKKTRRRPPRFELIAGSLCLDFVNTLDDRFTSQPKEGLASYIDLARFAEDTGILASDEVDQLFERSQRFPEPAQEALQEAIELREAIFAVFDAILKKKPVPARPLGVLNQFVAAAAQYARLVIVNGRFEWRFDARPLDFESPIWPLARSAADLLASDQLSFVRACASETCQWFFLDSSKNHGRRWCDMTKCGNRAKFRRFYKRRKKSEG